MPFSLQNFKIISVEADESPTVVLDRADATAPSLHQAIVSPDPFRDVIKTEPAPDLPSLIGEMKPLQSNFDFIDKFPLLRPPFRPEEDPNRLISKNKYNLGQQGHIQQEISSNYNLKEADQTLNHISETIPQRIDSLMIDHTTKKQENDTLSCINATKSTFVKSNVSKIDDINISTDAKLGETSVKANNSKFYSTTSRSSESDLDLEDPNDHSSKDTKTKEISTTSRSTTIINQKPEEEKKSSKISEKMEDFTESVTKIIENEIPMSVTSLLKLAGCNIYGRMYRVGRIITELSGPCLECRCTEIGVQCKQLKC